MIKLKYKQERGYIMNKNGFTLSEVLITLGIVGVIAAITVPSFIGNRPSENKLKLLKAHSALTSIIADLIDDETLYYVTDPANPCIGLQCNGGDINPVQGARIPGVTNGVNANEKLARIVASRMSKRGGINCNNNTCTFTTTDGTVWTFAPLNGTNVSQITIDVNEKANDTDNHNTAYSNLTAAQRTAANFVPDRFIFNVDRNGGVTTNDDFARDILNNPSNLSRKEIITNIKKGKVGK